MKYIYQADKITLKHALGEQVPAEQIKPQIPKNNISNLHIKKFQPH